MITVLKNRYGTSEFDMVLIALLDRTLGYDQVVWEANVITYNSETDCFVLSGHNGTRIVKAVHLELPPC